jgi:hypothetical protein
MDKDAHVISSILQTFAMFQNIADDVKENQMTFSRADTPCPTKSEIPDMATTVQSCCDMPSSASDKDCVSDNKLANDCKQPVVDPQFVFLTRSKHEVSQLNH